MLIFVENCRDVTFSNWLLTLMLPLISEYGNAPELKALQTNRIKYTILKVNFASVSLFFTHFSTKTHKIKPSKIAFFIIFWGSVTLSRTLQSLRLSEQIE